MKILNCGLGVLFTVAAVQFSPNCGAALLGIYEFTGTSSGDNQLNAVTTQPSDATFSTFTRVGVQWNAGANLFNSRGWSQSLAQDSSQYVHFTVTANTAFALDLTSLAFTFSRSSTGPQNGSVAIFLNGAAAPTASFSFTPAVNAQTVTWNSANGFPSIDDVVSVEFRFYGWSATDSAGTLRLDTVSVEGQVVPEPTNIALALFGVGLSAFAATRRWCHTRDRNVPRQA
jgi:hypothetical protein